MKLISWNVNGLRACIGKGFLDFVNFIDADVICLQETKLQPHQIELDLPQYHIYWNSADKKGYSGTAVFTKQEPLSVTYDFGEDIHRHEGRVITCEYPDFYLVCCYTPNSQDELRRYSWWSYRAQSRARNVGWRIDYFIVSERLRSRIENADILAEVMGSDHCPVLLELKEEEK